MPRKRTKPVAEHIETQVTAAPPSEPVPTAADPATPESLPAELPPVPPAPTQPEPPVEHHQHPEQQAEVPRTSARIEEALENVPGVVRGSEIEPPEKKRQFQPDPMPIESITLGESNLSPKMRLFRNNKFQQMAIAFDEKPPAPAIERLRSEGFKFRDGGWTKQFFTREEKDQLDDQQKSARRARVHLEVERTFHEIANGIRHDMGLAPVQAMGI